MKRNQLLSKEYLRFCKDTSDAGYEKAINEVIEEQSWEDFKTQTELLRTVLEARKDPTYLLAAIQDNLKTK